MRLILVFVLGMAAGAVMVVGVGYLATIPEARLRFDVNKDGGISFGEFRSNIVAVFRLIDDDNNGKLTREEFGKVLDASGRRLGDAVATEIWFKRFDANRDNIIDRDESNDKSNLIRWFKGVDRNDDGKIEIDEIEDRPGASIFLVR